MVEVWERKGVMSCPIWVAETTCEKGIRGTAERVHRKTSAVEESGGLRENVVVESKTITVADRLSRLPTIVMRRLRDDAVCELRSRGRKSLRIKSTTAKAACRSKVC